MKPEHQHWMTEYSFSHPYLLGHCWIATLKMKAAFPELRRVIGSVIEMGHFWCVDTDGTILDPTAHGQIGVEPIYGPTVPTEDEKFLRIVHFEGYFHLAFNGEPEAP